MVPDRLNIFHWILHISECMGTVNGTCWFKTKKEEINLDGYGRQGGCGIIKKKLNDFVYVM